MRIVTPGRAFRKIGQRVGMVRAAAGTDSFLASYPKSGRTWFRFILSRYFVKMTRDDEVVDLHTMFQVVPNFDLDPVRGVPAFRYAAQRWQIPLILVTHLRYGGLLFLRRPVVFMVRDPRDVIVSAYFHATRHKRRFLGDMDAFIADREQGLPALVSYLNGWAEGLKRRSHTVLSYEELTKDTMAASARVLRFLNLVPLDAALEEAVHAARFTAMRELELQHGLPAHDYDRDDVESLRMRRGKVGGFEEYLTGPQTTRIGQMCGERLSPAAKELLASTGVELR